MVGSGQFTGQILPGQSSAGSAARLRALCLGSLGPLGLESRVQDPVSPSNRVVLSVDITEQDMEVLIR